MSSRSQVSRRRFLQTTAAASAAFGPFMIVPRHVIGGQGQVPPSETFGGALIGAGGQGGGTYGQLTRGLNVKRLATCDVKFLDRADNQSMYTDFRRVLDRKDIDLVAIATPPHWHALISIAAAQAGKDVLCEKPMTRTIAEGRAVVEAFKRYGRVFQVGTFGRFSGEGLPSGGHSTRRFQGEGMERQSECEARARAAKPRLEYVLRAIAAEAVHAVAVWRQSPQVVGL
jgi:hypothetical protein